MWLRTIGSVALYLACTACATAPAPPPATDGTWRVAGSSGALFASTDGGSFGDRTELRADVSGGQFVSDSLMIEGAIAYADASVDDAFGGPDTEQTVAAAGGGVRWYFDGVSARRPYVSALAGLASVDVDIGGVVDESDTAPFLQGRIGMETFLTDTVALDFGFGVQYVDSLELGNFDEDVTSVGAFAGISIWP